LLSGERLDRSLSPFSQKKNFMLNSVLTFLRLYQKQCAMFAVCAIMWTPFVAKAAGGLLVAPTLIELDKRQHSQSLRLINGDTQAHAYRISLLNYRMDENGQLHETKEETGQDKFASGMIRYSPRQITLKPGEAQTVRVVYRRSANLAEGEYRSHLLFRKIPESRPPVYGEDTKSKLSINVKAIFGITIPVIIRHGELSATGQITQVKAAQTKEGKSGISMHVERTGERSLRGNLVVTADELEVARVNNLAIYLSSPYRRVVLPLDPGQSLEGKKVVVEYRENKKDGGSLIARSETIFR
jgi:P pilus assembly chaperone PapD